MFGHALYQIIVLIVIIFCAPGWLCEPYWNRCVGSADSEVCAWNPFYVDGPYYLSKAAVEEAEGESSGEGESEGGE